MYVDKSQWFQFILCGVILMIGYNFGLAIRDTKGIQETQIAKPIYQSIPVIPFTD